MSQSRKKVLIGYISDEYDWEFFRMQSYPNIYKKEFSEIHTKVKLTIEELPPSENARKSRKG